MSMITTDVHLLIHVREILNWDSAYILMCPAVHVNSAMFHSEIKKGTKPHSCYLSRLLVGAFLKENRG